jgi:hypothetical protein
MLNLIIEIKDNQFVVFETRWVLDSFYQYVSLPSGLRQDPTNC